MRPLFIDVAAVPCRHCDDALEALHKAMAQDPKGDDSGIWTPHENPWLTFHVEQATRQFQGLLQQAQDALARVLTGQPLGELRKATPPWLRWDEAAFQAAERRLAELPPEQYELSDWLMVCDYIVQRYLPDHVINSQAEYLTVRAALAGKIAAAMSGTNFRPAEEATPLVQLVETEFRAIPPRVLSSVELGTLKVSQASAAQHISDVTEHARSSMKGIVIRHVQGQVLGQSQPERMRQELFDNFGQLNRDFRRIAVTEAGECCNQGYILAQRPGDKVKRQEAYRGACPFCRSINGKTFTVVEPSKPEKDGETEIWPGKSNVGRSASPMKREGGTLVERQPSEMWWPAAGVQHPHCRGSWTTVVDKPPEGMDPAFHDWLAAKLKAIEAPPP